MGRSACCDKTMGLKKGQWTPEEDHKLLAYIHQHGLRSSWRSLPSKAGLRRCGKSCRLRWTNYLRPDIKRGEFSVQEEHAIIHLHALLGNRWSAIATHLPRRTDNEIKNYWNTHLKKKLTKFGIDPVTHKPLNNQQKTSLPAAADHSSSHPKSIIATTLSHRAQWESARLEAEARLARQSNLRNPEPDDATKQWSDRWTSKSTQGNSDKISPAKFESLATSTVTFLGDTTASKAFGAVDTSVSSIEFVDSWGNKQGIEQDLKDNGRSEKLPEYKEGAGNSQSFSPNFHDMSLVSIGGAASAENLTVKEDFVDGLLKNPDDPSGNRPSDGGEESESGGGSGGGYDDNKDYWNSILGEFLFF